MGSGDGSTVRNFIVCTVHLITARVIECRTLRWAAHIARMEEGRSAFKILTGKPTENISLHKPSSRWEDNIRLNLKGIKSVG